MNKKIKHFLTRLFKIDALPVCTINVLDFNNLERAPRASGRTTRLADMYIQLLFSTGRIIVADHQSSARMSHYLRGIIIRRLQIEHSGVRFDVRGNIITIERENCQRYEWR